MNKILLLIWISLVSTAVFAGEKLAANEKKATDAAETKASNVELNANKAADAEAVKMARDFFARMEDIKADFRQTSFDAGGKITQQTEGILYMRRPNQFRWDYTKPYEQMILADGMKLWVFDIDLDQVTVRDQKEAVDSTPASILTEGFSAVEKAFVTSAEGETQGIKWIVLTPKDQNSEYNDIMFGFKGEALEIVQIRDKFEQMTLMEFSNMQLDAKLAADIFSFTPPEGVDVIGK